MSPWNDRMAGIAWPESVTELHVHLGGSVPLYRLWETGVDRGIRGLGDNYEDFIERLKIDGDRIHDLDSYLEVYDRVELIQSGPAGVRESIIIALHRAYRTGGMVQMGPGGEGGSPTSLFRIGRLEIRFNPMKRTGAVFLKGQHAGLYDADRVLKAAMTAVEEVEIAFSNSMQAGIIVCFGRDMTLRANQILAEKINLWSQGQSKIVGIDLAGPESADPLSDPKRLADMKAVFASVNPALGRTVHVGETPHVDLETFIRTIEALNPSRVAHPIVAFRAWWEHGDDRGLKLLKERGIVCELCVRSNLLTRAVASVEEYGRVLRTLDEFGIPYTFSTDAPSLQNSSLAEELLLLLQHDAVNEDQILRALRAADEATFIPRRN